VSGGLLVGSIGGMGESESGRDGKRAARVVRGMARRITAFAGAHGGAEANVAYIGQRGARIVLVGQDGAWGDLVAPDSATALAATAEAGITVHEDFAGEFAGRMRTGPYEWRRMAGIQLGGRAGT
jgi:hypothetical protein